jgi:hypothetical protein
VRLRRVATRAGVLSKRLVLVVAAPPDARLVAPLGGAVEPLVHAPEAVQSARIGGIGVVDDPVLEHERAHARPIARVRGHVGSAEGRELGDGLRDRCRVHRVAAALVVVFDDPLALLLLGERDVEVEVEVAAERGRPGKRPPHPRRRPAWPRWRPDAAAVVGDAVYALAPAKGPYSRTISAARAGAWGLSLSVLRVMAWLLAARLGSAPQAQSTRAGSAAGSNKIIVNPARGGGSQRRVVLPKLPFSQ